MSRVSYQTPTVRLARLSPDVLDSDRLHAGTRKTLRSLGFEITKLRRAARLLHSRAKNGTLAADVVPFALRVPAIADHFDTPTAFEITVEIKDDRVCWAQPFDHESRGLSPVLLALFHLPALRSFWRRELRTSHFERLRRVLPKAWFVMDDPPVGAVVPDLGITSWDKLPPSAPFMRVVEGDHQIAVEKCEPTAEPVTLVYERAESRRG